MGIFREILARFPRGNLSYAFAYGSGVKKQLGYSERQTNNVIDMIFCVRDPRTYFFSCSIYFPTETLFHAPNVKKLFTVGWHAENIQRHPSHYSAMKLLGPRLIMKYQEKFGAGVYFNTLVPLQDIDATIKYGVVTRDQLLDDLNTWRHLYLAGRLQKPVQDIVAPDHDSEMMKALHHNLCCALQVALLILPERFNAYKLFHTISSLSYKGDFRMIFGENKQKVRNIVLAQERDFIDLYKPAMKTLVDYVAVDWSGKEVGRDEPVVQFEQDKSQKAIEFHLRHVPAELRQRLIRNAAFRGSYPDIVEQLAASNNLSEIVQVSVNDIVWRSSIKQSLKNIASAGLLKTLIYSYRKSIKTFQK